MADRIAVVGCARRKMAGPAPAAHLYIGTYFAACMRAARAVAPGQVFILSARYGLIHPRQQISSYDLIMGQPGSAGAAVVADQARGFGVSEAEVIALCGARYVAVIREVWPRVQAPLAGLNIGQQVRRCNELARDPERYIIDCSQVRQ